ncbi:GNAT family N-acetyltransferase [Vibrio spartinae]|uniref:N-acetyltransferase domain-containing protein n=1 Tax=Vibrio spartinae TaxID=1918945 RepID=A0A1N6M4X8_9VIBR|nr:GNAT family N-acetyltransferase [Vibrio spartinae]QMV16740.1 hypothetical protein Vspart_04145 [Vibrio spartinae]SIO94488.1 hypothetical protein VSP9026_02193 [Vibrio spartinae]
MYLKEAEAHELDAIYAMGFDTWHDGMFSLKDDCFGLGSVATYQSLRGKGYASHLVNLVKAELFVNHNCKILFLHSDIAHQFYSRLDFVSIEGADCMYISSNSSEFDGSIPTYF